MKTKTIVIIIFAWFLSQGNSTIIPVFPCLPSARGDDFVVFGRVDTVIAIKNRAKMDAKQFKDIRGSKIYWKEKYRITISADSSFGFNPDSSNLMVYAGEFQNLATDAPAYSIDFLESNLATQRVFGFFKYRNEYILRYARENPDVSCQEEEAQSKIKDRIKQKHGQ